MKKFLKEFDYLLFVTYFLLCVFGVVMVYSASAMVSVNRYNAPADNFYKKQLLAVIVGFGAFVLGMLIPYKRYREKWMLKLIAVVNIALLTLVLVAGYSPPGSGAQSWLRIGGFNFQPSELLKISLIIYVSAVLAKKYSNGTIDSIKESLIPISIIIIIPLIFLYKEPDNGAIALITAIMSTIILASGMSFKRIFKKTNKVFWIGIVLLLSIVYIYRDKLLSKILTEKMANRIQATWDPYAFVKEEGLQIINGYYAIALGGVSGSGLGESVQKLGYIPEPHTDFILAIIIEELGTLGLLIVVGGLGFIVMRAFVTALRAKDPMIRMMAVGIGSWIGFQTFLNIGGLSGIIPLTGVTLPFISYGGTSLVILSFALGILMNITMYVKRDQNKR
ncbi:FtsW/RodA/SpoVE family cell cycle protein [Kurthia gibsonii]|uniref:FtsW/RodA/SpoVE family cell cycle protein n=1 Tax=Kurthia gibsonii TaxID=33946 RepID=UPI000745F134|nr:cell cycle family protein [Kurthia sp. 11kri321]